MISDSLFHSFNFEILVYPKQITSINGKSVITKVTINIFPNEQHPAYKHRLTIKLAGRNPHLKSEQTHLNNKKEVIIYLFQLLLINLQQGQIQLYCYGMGHQINYKGVKSRGRVKKEGGNANYGYSRNS